MVGDVLFPIFREGPSLFIGNNQILIMLRSIGSLRLGLVEVRIDEVRFAKVSIGQAKLGLHHDGVCLR